jgi:hypothetical protein
MEIPSEFVRLAFNTLFAFDRGFSSDEEFAKLVFEGLDGQRRKTLLEFLNRVLDGRYDDREIDKLWSDTGTDYAFFRPGDTRQYLLAIRDELARQTQAGETP